MIEQRPGKKQHVDPGPDWGVRVIEPGPQAAAGGGWWDDFGSIGCCVGAYRGRGAVNYAASLVNLANPGVNDLTEIGGGPPGWNAVQGWFNFAALGRCLDTGLVPAIDQSWSGIIQFANVANFWAYLYGTYNAVFVGFFIRPNQGTADVQYGNGGNVNVAPQLLTGNLGVAGNQGYRNGAPDGGAIGGWAGVAPLSIYIGARNNMGIAQSHITADIWAAAFYDCTLNAAEMAAVAASMAAL